MKLVYQNESGLCEGSPEQFHAFTGSNWIDSMLVPQTPQQQNYSSHDAQLRHFLLPLYRAYQEKPPALYMRLGAGKQDHSIFTTEHIPKGTVVVEYLGEWMPSSNRPSSYRWGPIDALHYRNYAALIEDGFPNVGAFYLYDVDGIPLRVLLVAIDDIEPGDMIAVHYGVNHSVKLHYHREYRSKALHEYFSKNSLKELVKEVQQLRRFDYKELGWEKSLYFERILAKLRYLFQTPGSLYSLLAHEVLSYEEVFDLYDRAEFRYFTIGFSLHQHSRQKEISEHIEWVRKSKGLGISADLLEKVRHRIFFEAYLKPKVSQEALDENEALIWNNALDAIYRRDFEGYEFSYNLSQLKDRLHQASIKYAYEVQSPLLDWLQKPFGPNQPQRPAA